jgi:uncharacterized protein YlxW (UPF0749 family)
MAYSNVLDKQGAFMSTSAGMTLRTKLFGLSAFTVVALALLFVVALNNQKSQLLHDRQEKLRNLVESAHATVAHFEKQAKDGKLSADEARKAAAMDALRDRALRQGRVFLDQRPRQAGAER